MSEKGNMKFMANIIQSHPIFLYASDIADICKPLNCLKILIIQSRVMDE